MAWSTPKVDWATDDAVGTTDLNRIEGNQLAFIGAGISEAANGRMGIFATTGVDVVVNNTSITANTRIFLTVQNGAAAVICNVKSRIPGTSFTVFCDAGSITVAYLLIEPQ